MSDAEWVPDGVGLLIVGMADRLYTNQAGDIGCYHPAARGQLMNVTPALASASLPCFMGEPDAQLAAQIDTILADGGMPFVRVNRARLKDSMEGWVYCCMGEQIPAVLFWENCD